MRLRLRGWPWLVSLVPAVFSLSALSAVRFWFLLCLWPRFFFRRGLSCRQDLVRQAGEKSVGPVAEHAEDHYLAPDIQIIEALIRDERFIRAVEDALS